MAKYLKLRHEPFDQDDPKAIKEEVDDFLTQTENVGQTLKALREKKGWSQTELGKKVGLDKEHIAMIEKGEQPISEALAKRFAELFETKPSLFK